MSVGAHQRVAAVLPSDLPPGLRFFLHLVALTLLITTDECGNSVTDTCNPKLHSDSEYTQTTLDYTILRQTRLDSDSMRRK